MAMTMRTKRIGIVMLLRLDGYLFRRRLDILFQRNIRLLADIGNTDKGIYGGDQQGEGDEAGQQHAAPSAQET